MGYLFLNYFIGHSSYTMIWKLQEAPWLLVSTTFILHSGPISFSTNLGSYRKHFPIPPFYLHMPHRHFFSSLTSMFFMCFSYPTMWRTVQFLFFLLLLKIKGTSAPLFQLPLCLDICTCVWVCKEREWNFPKHPPFLTKSSQLLSNLHKYVMLFTRARKTKLVVVITNYWHQSIIQPQKPLHSHKACQHFIFAIPDVERLWHIFTFAFTSKKKYTTFIWKSHISIYTMWEIPATTFPKWLIT